MCLTSWIKYIEGAMLLSYLSEAVSLKYCVKSFKKNYILQSWCLVSEWFIVCKYYVCKAVEDKTYHNIYWCNELFTTKEIDLDSRCRPNK